MSRESILPVIKKMRRVIVTTREACAVSGKAPSAVVQGLNHLCGPGVLVKVRRGVWAEPSAGPMSPFVLLPYLNTVEQTYLSFISALHLHGIIEQVPGVVTCASLAHSRVVKTAAGVFTIHRIAPDFFFGFDWYKQEGNFLIAEPEKVLLDCLYLSGRKGNRYSHFPELRFPESFSFSKAGTWANRIGDPRLRGHVLGRLGGIRKSARNEGSEN